MRTVVRTRVVVTTHIDNDPERPATLYTMFPFDLRKAIYYGMFDDSYNGINRIEAQIGNKLAASVGGKPEKIESIIESIVERG